MTIALMFAAIQGVFEVVAELLQGGANPDAQNRHGLTALMCCLANNQSEVIPLLLPVTNLSLKAKNGKTVFEMTKSQVNYFKKRN